MKYALQFILVVTMGFLSAYAQAGLPAMDPDMGLVPTSQPKKNPKKDSKLPKCDANPTSAKMAAMIEQGYCLGKVKVGTKGVSMISLEEIEGGLLIIIERNPLLLSLAQFLKICFPLDGLMSDDGYKCMYTKKF